MIPILYPNPVDSIGSAMERMENFLRSRASVSCAIRFAPDAIDSAFPSIPLGRSQTSEVISGCFFRSIKNASARVTKRTISIVLEKFTGFELNGFDKGFDIFQEKKENTKKFPKMALDYSKMNTSRNFFSKYLQSQKNRIMLAL